MKLTYDWLKEYVALNVSAEKAAGALTMSGSEVEEIRRHGSDTVLCFEITSNRPDCLSVMGLAREAAALFGKDMKVPWPTEVKGLPHSSAGADIKVEIEAKRLCPFYSARIMAGVAVAPSRGKIAERLKAIDLRLVNNVVDITNYCLFELGQPLHAFDLDKIKGGRIVVRLAKKGERIVTIDGVERELDETMLVIADAGRPIAIAGVMGGKDTEVGGKTKNILLESAYFDPVSVRGTAKKLALMSDSSYRFERGVDKGMIVAASDRASVVIKEEAGGRIGQFLSAGTNAAAKRRIGFDERRASALLGVEIDGKWAAAVFRRLGLAVSGKGSRMAVAVPSFREDIGSEVDLVEEAARIFGYDKIPATLPAIAPPAERKSFQRRSSEKLKKSIASIGFVEIMSYNLVSERASSFFASLSGKGVPLANPLSEERSFISSTLLDGMLRAVSWNLNRKNENLALFEVGTLYSRSEKSGGFLETPALCFGMTGMARNNWLEKERAFSLFDLKGAVEESLFSLGADGIEIVPAKSDIMSPFAEVKMDGERIGFMGLVSKGVLDEYDIEQDVFAAEVKLDKVFKKAVLRKKYRPIPRFPFSTRDVSILCAGPVKAGEIDSIIRKGAKIVRKVELIDLYKNDKLPRDSKSLTYRITYGLDDRTLTDEEIEQAHASVKSALALRLNVTFR